MDKALIYRAMENSATISDLSAADLEKISVQYPYFTTAQVLLARSYKLSNDHRYTDQLHRTAMYASNRKVLYHLMREQPEAKVPLTVIPESIPEPPAAIQEVRMRFKPLEVFTAPIAEKTTAVITPVQEPSASEELASAILSDDKALASIEPTAPVTEALPVMEFAAEPAAVEVSAETAFIAEIPPVEEPPVAQEVVEEEAPAVQIKAKNLNDLDKSILIEAVNSTIELEVMEDMEEAIEEQDIAFSNEDIAVSDDSYAAWMARKANQLHYGDGSKPKPQDTEPDGMAQADWLRKAPDEKKTLPVQTISTPIKHPYKDHQDQQRNLIDRFIRSEPKITPGKAAEYVPGNIAKESLEEDFEFVTETMAKIFAIQGKIDKAKKAYKKLIEQHPEKSVYFAAQLKNLNQYKKG